MRPDLTPVVKVENMEEKDPVLPSRWRHSKSGRHYDVLFCGKSSETQEWLVVYQADYGNYDIWIRPLKMWAELVEVDGQMVPRFVKVSE